VLYREGDYVGGTVNLAARVAAEATRGQLLVTAAVRGSASGLDEIAFAPLGRREMRGISEPVELFEVRLAGADVHREVDPVCGMALSPSEVGAELSMGGVRYAFCSEACLQRFVADPGRHAT
jgi:YHS domain-containing protein